MLPLRGIFALALSLAFGLATGSGGRHASGNGTSAYGLIKEAGTYLSPDRTCEASLTVASMGGFLVLTTGRRGRRRLKVDDITGMAWVSSHTLAYTVSPMYGVPGVYVYVCDGGRAKRIVSPQTLSKAYPDGEDYFELEGVSTKKPITVYFYYAPSVDNVDFTRFRTPASVYQVHLDGSDFRKAEAAPR
jgi:hypothetical protein